MNYEERKRRGFEYDRRCDFVLPYGVNEMASKVAIRYLRRIKYSCFDRNANNENWHKLCCRVKDNFGTAHLFSRDRYGWVGPMAFCGMYDRFSAWVNGRYYMDLTQHQFNYMKKLDAIIQKTHRADRMAAKIIA